MLNVGYKGEKGLVVATPAKPLPVLELSTDTDAAGTEILTLRYRGVGGLNSTYKDLLRRFRPRLGTVMDKTEGEGGAAVVIRWAYPHQVTPYVLPGEATSRDVSVEEAMEGAYASLKGRYDQAIARIAGRRTQEAVQNTPLSGGDKVRVLAREDAREVAALAKAEAKQEVSMQDVMAFLQATKAEQDSRLSTIEATIARKRKATVA